jgi:hypothetical protein
MEHERSFDLVLLMKRYKQSDERVRLNQEFFFGTSYKK